jgi:hypothetical protein
MKRVNLDAYARERFGLNLYDFLRQKTGEEALYDYEIARILGVSRGRIGHLRRDFGIIRKNGFPRRFERRYGKGAVTQFKNMIENPENSLADAGDCFGFSREYARQVYSQIYGCPYTIAHRRKREERKRTRAECMKTEQMKQVSKVMKTLDKDRLSTRGSIHSVIERKFRGLRGINCRFRFGAANAVSLEIDQIISDRLRGATGPDPRTQGPNK